MNNFFKYSILFFFGFGNCKSPLEIPTGLPRAVHEQIDNRLLLSSALRLLTQDSDSNDQHDINQAIGFLEDILSASDLGPQQVVNTARTMLADLLSLRIDDPQAQIRARRLREEYLQYRQAADPVQEFNYTLYNLSSMLLYGIGGPVDNFKAYGLLAVLVNNFRRNPPQEGSPRNLFHDARIQQARMLAYGVGTQRNISKARALLREVQLEAANSADPQENLRARQATGLLNELAHQK